MFKRAVIIDGYVDEPASFGVPPYIGTYPRYIAGILKYCNIEYDYYTIDSLRENIDLWQNLSKYDLMILISGMTVPGKYVGGMPISLDEILKIGENFNAFKIIGGPIKLGYSLQGKSIAKPLELKDYDIFCNGDIEAVIHHYLTKQEIRPELKRNEKFLKEFAVLGAEIIKKHPSYPYVISEIETSRGCERDIFCSYCTEAFYGKVDFRDEEDIIEEVKALYENGERYFRIGRQANITAYKGKDKPNINAVKTLYEGIKKVAPDLKVLHSDNGNAGYIAKFEDETYEILKIIAKYNTAGDIIAFGAESFDPIVIEKNYLNSNPDDVIRAVRVVNEAGKERVNGIPKLLPGINLIYGLMGETNKTYEINFNHLKEILDEGLMLRRINIRKVMLFKNTRLYDYYTKNKFKINDKLFDKYKKKIREEIDLPMLKRVFPQGEAILKNVIIEYTDKNISFGRQLGTYSILVGIPGIYSKGSIVDVFVSNYGYRSITGLTYPFDINNSSLKEIELLPGIGKKRAISLFENKPFNSIEDIKKILGEDGIKNIKNCLKF